MRLCLGLSCAFLGTITLSSCSDNAPTARSGVGYGCTNAAGKTGTCASGSTPQSADQNQKTDTAPTAKTETTTQTSTSTTESGTQAQPNVVGGIVNQLGQTALNTATKTLTQGATSLVTNGITSILSGGSSTSGVSVTTTQATFLKKNANVSVSGNSSLVSGVDYCNISGTFAVACISAPNSTEYFVKGSQGCSALTAGYILKQHVTVKGTVSSSCP